MSASRAAQFLGALHLRSVLWPVPIAAATGRGEGCPPRLCSPVRAIAVLRSVCDSGTVLWARSASPALKPSPSSSGAITSLIV